MCQWKKHIFNWHLTNFKTCVSEKHFQLTLDKPQNICQGKSIFWTETWPTLKYVPGKNIFWTDTCPTSKHVSRQKPILRKVHQKAWQNLLMVFVMNLLRFTQNLIQAHIVWISQLMYRSQSHFNKIWQKLT